MKRSSFRILIPLAFAILSAAGMSGCGDDKAAMAAPVSEADRLIHDYDRASTEYGRVARKMKSGDVSITLRYIQSGKHVRELSAQLDRRAAQLSSQQKQRVAAISATNAPYLQP